MTSFHDKLVYYKTKLSEEETKSENPGYHFFTAEQFKFLEETHHTYFTHLNELNNSLQGIPTNEDCPVTDQAIRSYENELETKFMSTNNEATKRIKLEEKLKKETEEKEKKEKAETEKKAKEEEAHKQSEGEKKEEVPPGEKMED